MQLTLTLKITTALFAETTVNVNNSPVGDSAHPDDHVQLTYEIMTPGLTFHKQFCTDL